MYDEFDDIDEWKQENQEEELEIDQEDEEKVEQEKINEGLGIVVGIMHISVSPRKIKHEWKWMKFRGKRKFWSEDM